MRARSAGQCAVAASCGKPGPHTAQGGQSGTEKKGPKKSGLDPLYKGLFKGSANRHPLTCGGGRVRAGIYVRISREREGAEVGIDQGEGLPEAGEGARLGGRRGQFRQRLQRVERQAPALRSCLPATGGPWGTHAWPPALLVSSRSSRTLRPSCQKTLRLGPQPRRSSRARTQGTPLNPAAGKSCFARSSREPTARIVLSLRTV